MSFDFKNFFLGVSLIDIKSDTVTVGEEGKLLIPEVAEGTT